MQNDLHIYEFACPKPVSDTEAGFFAIRSDG